jgi:hypothetical protein
MGGSGRVAPLVGAPIGSLRLVPFALADEEVPKVEGPLRLTKLIPAAVLLLEFRLPVIKITIRSCDVVLPWSARPPTFTRFLRSAQ